MRERRPYLLERHFREAPQLADTKLHQIKAFRHFLKLFAEIPFTITR